MIDCKRGGAFVETALLLPILVLLMMIIAQIGVMVNLKLVVCEAAREAAREYATYAEDDSGRGSLCEIGKERAIEKYRLIISDVPYGEDFQISIQPRRNKKDVTVEVCCWCKTFIPKVGHIADEHNGTGFLLCGKAVFLQELRNVVQ